jgi:hypothetical protein
MFTIRTAARGMLVVALAAIAAIPGCGRRQTVIERQEIVGREPAPEPTREVIVRERAPEVVVVRPEPPRPPRDHNLQGERPASDFV